MKAKIVFLALIVLFLTLSCVTQKKCLQKFPPSTETITNTIVKDSIIYKDRIVEVKIPGALQIDSVPIPCPPPPDAYIPDTARAETEYAKAKAWFDYPNIRLKLIQKVSVLQVKLDSATKEAYHWKTIAEKVTVTPQPIITKYIPGFYKFCTFVFIGMVIATLGYLTFRIFVLKK